MKHGTSQENSEDMVKYNRQYHPIGENNSLSILTKDQNNVTDQIIEIHKIHKDTQRMSLIDATRNCRNV